MSELLILPDGFYGRCARRPSNVDPIDFKAAVHRWRASRNKSPLYLLDDLLWEREKNRLRKIWFELTPRQRQYLKDIRRETGKPIVEMRPFKGFKYQRGMLGGLGVTRSVRAGGGGATLALSSLNNDAINIDFNPPSALDAGFGLFQDGTHDRVNSSGQSQINSSTDWITPRNASIGQDYEIKWNLTVGSAVRINDENYTEDVWITLNVTVGRGRYVGKSTAGPSIIDQFEIDIGDDGTSTSDVNQDYSVEAGDLV